MAKRRYVAIDNYYMVYMYTVYWLAFENEFCTLHIYFMRYTIKLISVCIYTRYKFANTFCQTIPSKFGALYTSWEVVWRSASFYLLSIYFVKLTVLFLWCFRQRFFWVLYSGVANHHHTCTLYHIYTLISEQCYHHTWLCISWDK